MHVTVALIEVEDDQQSTVFGTSGILINEKYVLTTGAVLPKTIFKKLSTTELPSAVLTEFTLSDPNHINAVRKKPDGRTYHVERSEVIGYIKCKNIATSSIFRYWAIDTEENTSNLCDALSLFVILKVDPLGTLEELKRVIHVWWSSILNLDLIKGSEICCKSVPFGNRNFLDNFSKGSVSNILGKNSCLILSDCPVSPGGEGSPVYLNISDGFPIGIILSTLNWWKGEWIGLTLFADLRSLFQQILNLPISLREPPVLENFKLLDTLKYSIFQIYCGSTWGTSICINNELGLFITNKHVVCNQIDVNLLLNGIDSPAKVIFKTKDFNYLDLALIKCNFGNASVKSIPLSENPSKIGDKVFAAGFGLFPKESSPTPTLTRGHISQLDSSMIKTTCCVNPGSSGGAILDDEGRLIAVIVSNAKLVENGAIYPRVNMSIPYNLIRNVIDEFIKSGDRNILEQIDFIGAKVSNMWNFLLAKL